MYHFFICFDAGGRRQRKHCHIGVLFLVYINDVLVIFKLYADDVKLYTELKTAADESCFQGCLDLLYSWSVT